MLAPHVVQNMLDQLVPCGFHAHAFKIDDEVAVRVWAHEKGAKLVTASFVVDRPICTNGTPAELANHLKEQLCLVLEHIADGRELLLDLGLERIEMGMRTVFAGMDGKGVMRQRRVLLPTCIPAVTGPGDY